VRKIRRGLRIPNRNSTTRKLLERPRASGRSPRPVNTLVFIFKKCGKEVALIPPNLFNDFDEFLIDET